MEQTIYFLNLVIERYSRFTDRRKKKFNLSLVFLRVQLSSLSKARGCKSEVYVMFIVVFKSSHIECFNALSSSRSAFLAAHIPLFLYPFLHTVSKTRPFEYLRLTSLGVIGKLYLCSSCFIPLHPTMSSWLSFFLFTTGALVKTDEQEVINFLLTTEIIPLCLRIMESGSELSKTVHCYYTSCSNSPPIDLSQMWWICLKHMKLHKLLFSSSSVGSAVLHCLLSSTEIHEHCCSFS